MCVIALKNKLFMIVADCEKFKTFTFNHETLLGVSFDIRSNAAAFDQPAI